MFSPQAPRLTHTAPIAIRCHGIGHLPARLWRFGLLVCVWSFCLATASMQAQTVTEKILSSTMTDVYGGAMLASDGNYYSTTAIGLSGILPIDQSCPDGSDNNCTFITRITPSGTATVLHTFEMGASGINTDGYGPTSIIEGKDGNFYGSTLEGGKQAGTIFQITKAGAYKVIYTFPYTATSNPDSGFSPGAIIQGSDGNFYGTTNTGGPLVDSEYSVGTIFKITPAGVLTTLHTFQSPVLKGGTTANPYGATPISLVEGSDGNFYGTTINSSVTAATSTATGLGTIFSLTPDGVFTTLHNFPLDGSEGQGPAGPLVEGPDGGFYGTMSAFGFIGTPSYAGAGNTSSTKKYYGNFYKINSSGNLQVLYTFDGELGGFDPDTHLTLGSDGNFYGIAKFGGNSSGCTVFGGCGLVYQMDIGGTENVVYSFLGSKDGALPLGQIIQNSSGNFVGTTQGFSLLGNAYSLTYTPAMKGPIQISFDPTTVGANQPVKLTWKVLNAFSNTMQQCHASILGSPTGAGSWTGPQVGTETDGAFGDTATITPTAEGTYTYALNCGGIETGFGTLIVGNLLTVDTNVLPEATVGKPYSQAILATGGSAPYAWTLTSGILPLGLSFDVATGVVSGMPEQFGDVNLEVQVEDHATPPAKATATVGLAVQSGLDIGTVALPKGIIGTKYAQALAATGGKAPYSWSLISGKLPAGITFSPSTGVFAGTPTAAASVTFLVQVKDSEKTPATKQGSVSLAIAPPVLVITTSSLPVGKVGINYSQALAHSGGTAPFIWTITAGTLPKGLTLASGAGVISGTPLQFQKVAISIEVVDSSKPQMKTSATLNVDINSGLLITTATLDAAKVGSAYSAGLAATGGKTPYKWAVSSGALPEGLTLATETGLIFGTPTKEGISSFTIQITDSEGTPASTTATFTINVTAPTLGTSNIKLVSSAAKVTAGTSVTLTATVSGTGSVPNGVVTFRNGSTSIGTGTLNTSGVTTLKTAFAKAGTYPITATYSGDSSHTGSTSATLTETVVAAPVASTTKLASSALKAVVGAGITFTATVSGAGGIPAGTVSFLNGSTSIGTETLSATGVATLKTAFSKAGAYSIKAVYAGSTSFTTSTSSPLVETIVAATTTKLTSSAVKTTAGASVTLTATVTGAGGIPTGSVTFLNGSTSIGTATLSAAGVATFKTDFGKAGTYAIKAVYAGSSTFNTSTSAALTETVAAPIASTTKLASSAVKTTAGASITLTATVTGTGGIPAGSVTFLNGSTSIGTGTLSAAGIATLKTDFSKAGTYSIKAVYAGGPRFNTSTSAVLTETVAAAPAASSTELVSSAAKTIVGASISLTATVTGSGGTPAGSVSFLNGTTSIGTATLTAAGVATFKTDFNKAGTYSIKAIYAGGPKFNTSTSAGLTLVVTAAEVASRDRSDPYSPERSGISSISEPRHQQ